MTSPESRSVFRVDADVDHDSTTNYVADQHVLHAGVSVIAASAGLAAVNDDLTVDIGLSVDVSTLGEFTATAPADLDVDQVIIDNNGTVERADAGVIVTPEIDSTVSGTSDTLDAANFGKIVPYSSTSTITVTLPDGLKTGFWAVLRKTGATGTLTIAADTTLETKGGNTDLTQQYDGCTVVHMGSDVWWAYGNLA